MTSFNNNQNEDDILAVLKQLTEEYIKLKKYNIENLSKIDHLHNEANLNKAELAMVKAELATVTNNSALQITLANCKAENTILLANANCKGEFITKIDNITNIVSLFEVENSNLKDILEELRHENNTLRNENNILHENNNILYYENNILKEKEETKKKKRKRKRKKIIKI